jgi:SAM-dependent methyltransferase
VGTQATEKAAPEGHLERFDPDRQGGRLIDAEHRGRYWWAAQVAAGKEVLDAGCGTGYGTGILQAAGAASVIGVDVSVEAVEMTARRLGNPAAVVRSDLRELPFDDDSFDLVVCWETIEHLEEGQRAVGEFRRVLRPGGLLLISSPNPDVYPSGNEHHVHEYRPSELAAMVGERFANVASYRQHPWVASVIEPAGGQPASVDRREVRAVESVGPGKETYALLAASDAPLSELPPLVTLAGAFEVRWWSEQLTETRRLLARVEAQEVTTRNELTQTSSALLEANQSLVRLPLLERHLEEQRARIAYMEHSMSWRLTAPLRRFRRLARS